MIENMTDTEVLHLVVALRAEVDRRIGPHPTCEACGRRHAPFDGCSVDILRDGGASYFRREPSEFARRLEQLEGTYKL
ncbi:MAG: hypothetical protein R3D59_18135 [Paracoccaceae bacterium]